MHAGAYNGTIGSQVEPGVRLPLEQQLRACSAARSNPVPVQLLRKYIAYARTFVAPVLSAEAKDVRIPHHLRSKDHMNTHACATSPEACPAQALLVHQLLLPQRNTIYLQLITLQGECTLSMFAPGTKTCGTCLQALQAFYLKARRGGATPVTGLPVNLRLLETLIHLCEARARADLRQVWPSVPGRRACMHRRAEC